MVEWLKHHAYDQHGLSLKPSTLLIEKSDQHDLDILF